jgi:hypothetical protein
LPIFYFLGGVKMSRSVEERLTNPNWADALFFGFNPNALHLVNALVGNQRDREERAFRHQQAERDYDLRKQVYDRQAKAAEINQQDADTNLQLKLHDAGAIKGNPDLEKALTDALGPPTDPRQLINTRVGAHYLPTEKEQRQKYLEQKRAERGIQVDADLDKEARKQELTTTEIEIPGVGPVNIPNASVARTQQIVEGLGTQKFSAHRFIENRATGEVTFIGIDAKTGEHVTVPLGTIGTRRK